MGGLVQQTFLRHAAHGAEMLVSWMAEIARGRFELAYLHEINSRGRVK